MTTKKTALEHVLTTLGYEDDEKAIVKKAIGTLCRVKTITKESLKELQLRLESEFCCIYIINTHF